MIVPTSVKVGIAGFLKSPSCFDNWGFFRLSTAVSLYFGAHGTLRWALVSKLFPNHETADSLQSRKLVLRLVRFPATARKKASACRWPADLPTANQPATGFERDPVL